MTGHQEGDRIEFDTLDQGVTRGVITKTVHVTHGRQRGQVIEYVIRDDGGHRHYLPPQHCYPERTTTP